MPEKQWVRFFRREAPGYMDNVFTKNTLAEVDFIEQELSLRKGQSILDIGCGTAGNWGRRPIELDEYEIMVLAARRP